MEGGASFGLGHEAIALGLMVCLRQLHAVEDEMAGCKPAAVRLGY